MSNAEDFYDAGTVGGQLTELLTTGQVPRDINELAQLFGENQRQQNAAMVRLMSGLEIGERRPPKRTAEGRRYDANAKALERYRKGQRDPSRDPRGRRFMERLTELAKGQMTGANLRRARREGFKMRMQARHRVSKRAQTSVMPANAGGHELWLYLDPGEELNEILDIWESGDRAAAGDMLEALFFEEYEMPEPDELSYEWVELRFQNDEGQQWFKP